MFRKKRTERLLRRRSQYKETQYIIVSGRVHIHIEVVNYAIQNSSMKILVKKNIISMLLLNKYIMF